MTAERDVRLSLNGSDASGSRAYYKIDGPRDRLQITGQPLATIAKPSVAGQTNVFQLRNADSLIWEGPAGTLFRSPTNGVLRATGRYKLLPVPKP
jgi:hypothetical protein